MTVFDLFSKRQKRLRGEVPEVFIYDEVSAGFRVQVFHIVHDVMPPDHDRYRVYKEMHDTVAREHFHLRLRPQRHGIYGPISDYAGDFLEYFLQHGDAGSALDCIEVLFKSVWKYRGTTTADRFPNAKVGPESATAELNTRFREHGLGYQFESGELVRVDSTLVHQEAVKPTLTVLREPRYAAAEGEYLNAYEHYRHGRHEEAITEALKALESVLKVILKKRGWAFEETDTAKKLLGVAFEQGLVPTYLQSEFSALRATLEAGVPTVRNKRGGHGAGEQPRSVPRHLVSYVLHLTASSILFLTESDEALV